MNKNLITISLLIFLVNSCQNEPVKEISVSEKQVQPAIGNIVFSQSTGDYWQIWTMQSDGKKQRQLTFSPSDKRYPSWRKHSTKILYRNNNNQAIILDPQKAEESRILSKLGLIGSLSESPGGDKLLLVRFRTEVMDSSDLWIVSIDGKDRKILTRDVGLQYDPVFSPDGKKIAYISGHGYQTHELFVMDSDGSHKKQLTKNKALELLPAFAPSGQKIAYVSDATGDYEIWVMDTDGSNAKQLTDSEGIDTRPCWSPDGSQIMFVSDRSGELQLWIMNSNGSDPVQLTRGAPSMDPAWRMN